MKIPKIKRGISDFLTGEEGNISKKNLVTVAMTVAAVAAATKVQAQAPHYNGGGCGTTNCSGTTSGTTKSTTGNPGGGNPGTTKSTTGTTVSTTKSTTVNTTGTTSTTGTTGTTSTTC